MAISEKTLTKGEGKAVTPRSVDYRDHLGMRVEGPDKAFFRFEQFSDNKWVLSWQDNGTWVCAAEGIKGKCLDLMRMEVRNYKATLEQETSATESKRRTRNAARKVSEEYYDSQKRWLDTEHAGEARYAIRKMSNNMYRIVGREGTSGHFHQLTRKEFAESHQAFAYFMLLVGADSLEFSNARHQVVEFEEALYCKRSLSTGTVEIYKLDDNSWDCVATGSAEEMTEWHEPESETFMDNLLVSCDKDKAVYKEYVAVPGILHHLYKKEGSSWHCIKRGSPTDITGYKSMLRDTTMQALEAERAQEAPAPAPATVAVVHHVEERTAAPARGRRVPIEDVLWGEIRDTTWLLKENVAPYLSTLTRRNRHVGISPVYDTRLYDNMKQPIYIADLDFGKKGMDPSYVNLGQLRIFKALYEVQSVFPSIQTLPAPLQLAQDPASYLWDPTAQVLPITTHTMDHILDDRSDRLPAEFVNAPKMKLLEYLKNVVVKGEAQALRDPFFALPCYSSEDDIVSMMLPVYSSSWLSEDKVVAALVLRKGPRGYQVKTLLDIERAVRSVSIFCDPRNTWLKECYDECRAVDTKSARAVG